MMNINDPTESGAVLPALGPDATLAELHAAYAALERSDAPEFLMQRVLFDLAERIRDFGKAPPEPMGEGRSVAGMTAEQLHSSGFKGKVWHGDVFVKA